MKKYEMQLARAEQLVTAGLVVGAILLFAISLAIYIGIEVTSYLNAMSMAGTFPIFIRLPGRGQATRQIPDGNGGYREVSFPQFHLIRMDEIASVTACKDVRGCDITLKNGKVIDTRTQDDEVQYILAREGANLAAYDYNQEQESARALNNSLRPSGSRDKNAPVLTMDDFRKQHPIDADGRKLTMPADTDRVGPGAYCRFGNHQIEDGMQARVVDGDIICWTCYEQIEEKQEAATA